MQPSFRFGTPRSVTETPTTAATDRILAERVQRDRDEGAFRALYRRHTPAVHQFALRLLGGDEHEAEDVVQETWIRAVERLGDFRWEASLRSWLSGIALNLCRALFRRRDRGWVTLQMEHVPLVDPRPDVGMMDLETAIAGLPDGYRTVLVLHDVEGFTHEEIGLELEISPNTSKSQLSRARSAVRAALADHGTAVRAEP